MAQNGSKWNIDRASVERREDLAKFHIDNHLAISVGSEEEKVHQEEDIQNDFPHLLGNSLFEQGFYWIATSKDDGSIAGCIGLNPSTEEKAVWLTAFSVASSFRGQGLGKELLQLAIQFASSEALKYGWATIKLVTLDRMEVAKAMYSKVGFDTKSTTKTNFYKVYHMEQPLPIREVV